MSAGSRLSAWAEGPHTWLGNSVNPPVLYQDGGLCTYVHTCSDSTVFFILQSIRGC